jgi:hypothetical protein
MYLNFSLPPGRQATVLSQSELNHPRFLYSDFKACRLRHSAMFCANVYILEENSASILRVEG